VFNDGELDRLSPFVVFATSGMKIRGNRLSWKRGNEEDGASAVEFAIIASLLFLILFGTITFGITFNKVQGLHASGREGARLGALTTTTRAEILSRVRSSVAGSIVNAANIADNCAQNPPTGLTPDTGCVDVFINPAPGTLPGSWTKFTSPTSTPCGTPPATATAPAIVVQVFYRLRIDIPLWSSPAMTVKGNGEFRCEQ
jgi:Flp pilus assembly protein TadG